MRFRLLALIPLLGVLTVCTVSAERVYVREVDNEVLVADETDDVATLSTFGVSFEEELVKSQEELAIENCPYNVPYDSKSWNITWMPYQAVTSRGSNQYKLLYSEEAYTDEETGLRMYDGRYCVALGTGWCYQIGTKVDIVMENGAVFKCILGDVKSDAHTDASHKFQAMDGSVLEMIRDNKYDLNYPEDLKGRIVKVVVLD